MTAVKEVKIATRSERQATERKFWVQEAADYLVKLGFFGPEERPEAVEYATRLVFTNTDENGELTDSPKDAVDEDLSYYAG